MIINKMSVKLKSLENVLKVYEEWKMRANWKGT